MSYAIIDAGGQQLWIEPGKFYDMNYIEGNPGDILYLNRILLLFNNGIIKVGKPCLTSHIVKIQIVKHLKSAKVIVFKMKSKKNARVKRGHRQQITRIVVKDIN